MTDINHMRDFVAALYPDRPWWKKKVANMPDNQVMAIFFKEQNAPPKKDEPTKESEGDDIPF